MPALEPSLSCAHPPRVVTASVITSRGRRTRDSRPELTQGEPKSLATDDWESWFQYLVVRDERLSAFTHHEKRLLEVELQQQLDALDELISGQINWEQESGLMVCHPRISELQEGWEQRLGSHGPNLARFRKGPRWRLWLAVGGIALVATVPSYPTWPTKRVHECKGIRSIST